MDRDAEADVALAGAHDVPVHAGTLEHEARIRVRGEPPDVRRGRRRPDLLVGVRDEDQSRQRQAAGQRAERLDRVQAGEQAALHVRDARARRDAVRHGVRALRHRPLVEHRVHVADAQERGPVRIGAGQLGDDRVAQPFVIRVTGDGGAERFEAVPCPAANLVHARLGVRAAVDIDEVLEISEIGGVRALDGGAKGREVGSGDTVDGRWGHVRNLPDDDDGIAVPHPCPI